ncbi:MAG: transposase [Candidatus Saccharimonadales bacterium]
MPSRNTVRKYDAPAYYHVYNRGAGGMAIFRETQDKRKFLFLLRRYLSDDPDYVSYPTYDIELLAYCIMGNHFHLLLFQERDPTTITQLLRSVSTAYSMYYNLKYKSHGHVFQSVFKASRVTEEPYLAHITRYIHLNPETYKTYKRSSLPYYLGTAPPDWVKPSRLLDMTPTAYEQFLDDYKDRRELLKEIGDQLAQ